MLSGVYCFAVFVWIRGIGLVFLLSIFSATALTKYEAKHIVPAHGALLISKTQWKGLINKWSRSHDQDDRHVHIW